MTDQIEATIYNSDDEVVSVTHASSVREYAMGEIMKAASSTTASGKAYGTMFVDMLNYGAAAQEKFGYNLSDLANSDLTEELQEKLATADEVLNTLTEETVGGAGYSTTTLSLESNIVMNLIFFTDELGGDLDNLTATITYSHHNDPNKKLQKTISGKYFKEYSPKDNRARCYVEVDWMDIPDGDQVVTCEITDQNGNVVGMVSETVNSFLYRGVTLTTNPLYPSIAKFTYSAYIYLNKLY